MVNSSDEIQTVTLIKLPAFFYSSRSRALLFVLALLFCDCFCARADQNPFAYQCY
jgi:hypothetical protein